VVGDYFGAMGIRLQRGRVFQGSDREDAPPVAVVNETLARDLWGDEDPVGRRIGINWDGLEEVEIIGVVQDVLLSGFDSEPRPTVYLHYPQKPYFTSLNMVVRSSLPATRLLRAMERELHDLDPALALSDGQTMESIVSKSVARPRLTAMLMGLFALLAATLAAVGLYGVLAYAVSRRVREIGLRIAIGAGPGEVVGLVLRRGLLLCGAGLLLGLGGALAGGRILESVLFGVTPADPVSLGAAAIFLLIVALLATGLPAWRASRVAPMEALRAD
jgi:predicted permease